MARRSWPADAKSAFKKLSPSTTTSLETAVKAIVTTPSVRPKKRQCGSTSSSSAPATSPDKKLRREANYELKLMLAVEKSQAKYLRAAERDFRVAHKVMEAKEARIDRDKSASEESKMLRVFKAMNTLREKEAAFNREWGAMLVVKFKVSQAQIVCKDLEIARLARIVRCQKKLR